MSKSVSRLTNLLLSSNGSDIALLLLRIFVGIMMLTHGVAKIENFSTLKANFPDPVGLGAGFSLLLITCAEVGCSLLVIVGLVTRLAVIPLIVGITASRVTRPTITSREQPTSAQVISNSEKPAPNPTGSGKFAFSVLKFSILATPCVSIIMPTKIRSNNNAMSEPLLDRSRLVSRETDLLMVLGFNGLFYVKIMQEMYPIAGGGQIIAGIKARAFRSRHSGCRPAGAGADWFCCMHPRRTHIGRRPFSCECRSDSGRKMLSLRENSGS